MMNIERGGIFLADLDPTIGVEIRKTRPVIVVTNDLANMHSNIVTIIPLTSKNLDRVFRFELLIGKPKGLTKSSKALIQQIRSIDKSRIKTKLAKLSPLLLSELEERIKLHLGLG